MASAGGEVVPREKFHFLIFQHQFSLIQVSQDSLSIFFILPLIRAAAAAEALHRQKYAKKF
jgi:hypothetical protein